MLADIVVGPEVPPAPRLDLFEREAERARPFVRELLARAPREPTPRRVFTEAQAWRSLLTESAPGAPPPPFDRTAPERVAWALDWIAARIVYRPDASGAYDFVAPAALSLVRGYGDCEDLAIVLCAVLRELGIGARIVWLNQPDAPVNHVSVQAALVGGWAWCDPSVSGALVGEHPYDAALRRGEPHRADLRGV